MPDGPPTISAAPDSTASSWDIDKGRLVIRDGAVLPEIDFSGGNGSPLEPLEIRIQAPTGGLIAAFASLGVIFIAACYRSDGYLVTYGFWGAIIAFNLLCLGLHFRVARRGRITVYVTGELRRSYHRRLWIYRTLSVLLGAVLLWVMVHADSHERTLWSLLFLFIASRISAPPCNPTCTKESQGWFQLMGVPREVLLQLAAMTSPRDWNDQRPLGSRAISSQPIPGEPQRPGSDLRS